MLTLILASLVCAPIFLGVKNNTVAEARSQLIGIVGLHIGHIFDVRPLFECLRESLLVDHLFAPY